MFWVGGWLMANVAPVVAQNNNTSSHSVKVLTRAYKDSIKLRWAPATPLLWKYGRQYGYQVEKFLVFKAGKILPQPQPLPLPQSRFRPQTPAAWAPYLEKDAQVTVAYEAMFGKKMPITSTNRMLKIAERAQEQELRFAFALMAADYSAVAAKLSGLSFTDTAVKKGEKYLYQVKVLVPQTLLKSKEGAAYVGIDEATPLPKPVELEGQFGDKTVLLVWNQLYYQRTYSAYYVERSVDGKKYSRTTRQPYAMIQKDTVGAIPTRYMTVVDSLPKNNQTYYFRVRGITPFAETGPPSDTVITGQGQSKNALNVALQKPLLRKGKVLLQWKFDVQLERKIQGFVIEKASKARGKYEALHQGVLPATERQFTDQSAGGASYYQVKVMAKKGSKTEVVATSFPHLVQLPDSIPPDAPLRLTGTIDTTGIVTIRWSPPQAKDVKGYHIYRSEGGKDEYTRINVVLNSDTTYADSISLQTLNPNIYYKIQAVDHYFNPSILSKVLLLKRPDKVPPLSPAFVGVTSTDSSINLQFQASTSGDVAHHLLYRTEWGKDTWQLQRDFTRLDTITLKLVKDTLLHQSYYAYADKSADAGQKYQYTLVAIDSTGLESPPSRPVTGSKISTGLYPPIKNIQISKDGRQQLIQLLWQYLEKPAIKTFRVYRAEGEARLRMYQTFSLKTGQKQASFQDKQVQTGQWYQYRIQAIAPDGGVSKFSKVVKIKY